MAEETIAALATPPGEGGIGIIRISGYKSFDIAREIFLSSRRNIDEIKDRYLYHGYIKDFSNDKVIDEVLIVFMKAPYTYTREDVVEINCHGGIIPVKETLELIYSHGARPAEPGEFTKRAFLNGRLDLSQAEGVIDLITSKTNLLKDVALQQLRGSLKEKVENLRDDLMTIMANLEAKIDFPDEDIEVLSQDELMQIVQSNLEEIKRLISSYDKGRIIKEGINTIIVGKPNVGKSSLLNILLGEDRAIVTEVPGTTRDTIEEVINLDGIPLKIVDTAGIRQTEDKVEKIGVNKTKSLVEKADLILIVLDKSRPLSSEDYDILKLCENKTAIVLLNKSDLKSRLEIDKIREYFSENNILNISALEASGIDRLKDLINLLVFEGTVYQQDSFVITNVRQYSSLKKVEKDLESALNAFQNLLSEDLISIDIKNALEALGEISGDTVSDNVIDEIFSRFCIGK
ncbi:tRNA uridine-5-carboxymethylaminomethyl(34) synthesis GTPase MnmE [Natranaerofaba carboxydovora]|uniref:tRNA uridine-5-carboxymethylaminomethyl(34) synthesis GTPase MnmE n=1 Tax=Natranaerofaba carboxydovora TaxID=2742683 RepID=UPI001F1309AC|nr:tRNA uridine-5-carboxymethylaminomethyl(34) synthesis GTPase MnmE [Natranaerofaba carboxydovora]UMZ75182.1 tRNA modification GTPase MnmE [Natranaerofaba carboxydovora]